MLGKAEGVVKIIIRNMCTAAKALHVNTSKVQFEDSLQIIEKIFGMLFYFK